MRTIIIISEIKQDIEKLISPWNISDIQLNSSNDEFNLKLEEGWIYFRVIEEEFIEYEENELENIKLTKYHFYDVSYTSIVVLEKFIFRTNFNGKIYIDDDFGEITTYDDFCKSFKQYCARFSNEI